MNEAEAFEKYVRETYPRAISALQDAMKPTDLGYLEALVLRFGQLLEQGKVAMPTGASRDFVRLLCAKLSQEAYALVWALKGGSLYGATHHERAIIEMYAMLNHVVSNPVKMNARLDKFNHFKTLHQYQHYTDLKRRLDGREIDQERFDQGCMVSPATASSFTDEKKKEWLMIWKPTGDDLMLVRNWYSSATLDNMVQDADLDGTTKTLYGTLCHGVHLSPMSMGLVGDSLVLQKNQIDKAQMHIEIAAMAFYKIVSALDKTFQTGLFQPLAPILKCFKTPLARQLPQA